MRFWRWLTCEHRHVRCVHGDEIIARGCRRVACLDCGRSLDEPLPEICAYTGAPHSSSGTMDP